MKREKEDGSRLVRDEQRERKGERGGGARETETAPTRRAYPVLIRTNHPLSHPDSTSSTVVLA